MGERSFRQHLGTLWEKVRLGVPLAELTTLGVGGPARYLATCHGSVELRSFLAAAKAEGLPVFILGGGSNLLVSDRGFAGLVIQLGDSSLSLEERGGSALLRASAGVEWDSLVARAVDAGYGGVECLAGIPGRVGAAPIQNIGAYGQDVAAAIETVKVLERSSGEVSEIAVEDCGFAYRSSHFKQGWRDRYVLLEVSFHLPRRRQGEVRYADLQRYFDLAEGGASPSLAAVREAVLDIRRSKSMLADPEDANSRSAGSFFVNPVVAAEAATALVEAALVEAAGSGPAPPAFPMADGRVKLSAAWLIEQAGFQRGLQQGQAGLSTRHVLALINRGGASAVDILTLAARVRQGVRRRWGVSLLPEPVFLGFDESPAQLLDRLGEEVAESP
jgi:UDP-N-acetylmuramate dehydrogenase